MKTNFFVLKLKTVMLYTLLLFVLILLIANSPAAMLAVQNALILCYKTIIPSLFPFFVLSGMLTGGSLVRHLSRILSPVMLPLFRVRGAGALPFILGTVSGYPTGAKITAELYRATALSKDEAERLLPFTNNAGPLFIIGAVGTGMLGRPDVGQFLYGVHLVSALLVGFCFRFRGNIPPAKSELSDAPSCDEPSFSKVISNSIHTLLLVCGYILFFAAATACLTPVLAFFLPHAAVFFCKVAAEVAGGALLLTQNGLNPRLLLTCLSALIGFGGLCVAMQVSGIITPTGLSVKPYLFGKILQGGFAALFTYLLYPLVFAAAPTFAVLPTPEVPSRSPLTLLPTMTVLLFLCITTRKRKHRPQRKEKK